MMQYIRWMSVGALVFAAGGCMATEEDLAAVGKSGDAEGIAAQTEALATCHWGGGGYVRKGFTFSKTDLSILSPFGSQVRRYTPMRGSATYDSVAVLDGWGGADYTWAADINNDGFTDLISASGSNVHVHKYFSNNFTAGFDSKTWATGSQWGAGAYTFVADFSGDSKLDIVSGNGGHLYYRKTNAGATGFSAMIDTWNDGRWGGGGFTFAGDFNGDKKADIVSFNGTSAYMKFKSSENNDAFTMGTWGVSGSWSGSGHTYAGDINGDGRTDIVTINGPTVTTYRSNSTATNFVSNSFNDGAVVWGDAGHTFLADFDNDGAADLVTINGANVYMFQGKKGAPTGNAFKSVRASTFPLSNYMLGDSQHTFAGPVLKKTVGSFEVSAGADIVTFSACSGRVYRFSDGSNGLAQGFDTVVL